MHDFICSVLQHFAHKQVSKTPIFVKNLKFIVYTCLVLLAKVVGGPGIRVNVYFISTAALKTNRLLRPPGWLPFFRENN